MMGASHGLAGAAAGLGAGLALAGPGVGFICGVVGYLAAYAPDLDHPRGTAVRVLGPVGWLLCRVIRAVSAVCGLPRHRGLSHTALFAVLVAAAVGGVAALWLSVAVAAAVGVAAFAGVASALLGDWATVTSLPLVLWPATRTAPTPPRVLRLRTGGVAERLVVVPVLVALVVALGVAAVVGVA